MCGRMTLTRSGSEIADYFAEAMRQMNLSAGDGADPGASIRELNGAPLRPRFNVAPTQDVLTVVSGPADADLSAEFAWKRWGLVPSWAKNPEMGSRLFNARSETVDVKPSFRTAFKRRRCLVAADGFYEWTPKNRDHQPFHFRRSDGALMAFAGLHESWRGEGGEVIESCTVLTTEANHDLEGVHHRMPVILDPADCSTWLDQASTVEVLKALLPPSAPGLLKRTAVGRRVNNARLDDPSCLEPESPLPRSTPKTSSKRLRATQHDPEEELDDGREQQAELFAKSPDSRADR